MFFQRFQPHQVGLCVQEHIQVWFVLILEDIVQQLFVITLNPIGFTRMKSFDTGNVCTMYLIFFCYFVQLLFCLFVCLFVCLSFHYFFHRSLNARTHMFISTCKIDQREDKVRKKARSRRICKRVLQRDLNSRVTLISVIGIIVSGCSCVAALQGLAP